MIYMTIKAHNLFVCKISQPLHILDWMLTDWTDLEGTERIWAGD